MTPAYGLIGYPLTHSFSPAFFRKKFQREGIAATYQPFILKDVSQLPGIVNAIINLRGLNVTLPYKTAVIPYLHAMSDVAEAIGAVNCIDIRNGQLKGYNTDVTGFAESLKPLLESHHHHALVLGKGGSARAVCYVLEKLGIRYQQVSRQVTENVLSYADLNAEIIASHLLIINTTPLGMFPDVHSFPAIPYEGISSRHLLFDLIYNPQETLFLQNGKNRGAAIKNGLEMLQLQAEASWKIWTSEAEK